MENRHQTGLTPRSIAMTKRTPTYHTRPTTTPDSRTGGAGFIRHATTIMHRAVRPPMGLQKVKLADPTRVKFDKRRQRKLVLLLPGHNEELIIATTIQSAIAAGQDRRDIYVVDDNSSDNTRAEAIRMLGKDHVLSVQRSGKALAVKKAIKKFDLDTRYQWLHIADADSVFGANYFRIYRKKLDVKKYAVAVGFVQSLRGNWISTYRAASYTYSQHVNRRVQSKLGMISVFPGPITCFRTDILHKLDFEAHTLTEDFDITLQVHRYKLGKILYIPKAVNYTQDPQSFGDFCKQNLRWQRGFFQGVKKYKIGLKPHAIDVSIGWQVWQAVFYLLQMFVLLPYIVATTGNWGIIPFVLAADFVLTGLITMASSVVIKRWNLLSALPYFYFLRWVEIGIFVWAFVEIYALRKFQTVRPWDTEGRRYKLDANALKDAAA
jgi:cellulose synthase/poly-beta-1,6-N-acetylglucosamine synthase-like glycosyltransferase